ncbi:MAG: aspartate--tRNA ligase [Bacilli bacterium]|nr:aspartate--tRNA ligase [Bacilli bacterium]
MADKAGISLIRTHQAGALRINDVGSEVVLSGWVQRRRDLGGVIFIDLRDRSGIVQAVFAAKLSNEALETANQLRNEFVISVRGQVVKRDPDTVNPKIATGDIEVQVLQLEILNAAKNPPFYIEDRIDVDENVRLKHRYLDLRRPVMRQTFELRHKAIKYIRDYLDSNEFMEVETPILTKSTPEGARDYLVPSRLHDGEFYALPQSPQLFKQLLMVSGFERYFQVARCFRDEDLRADRQPEFTQVDIEQSFIPLPKFQAMMEQMISGLFEHTLGKVVPGPFQRITYAEAMELYGSDKPDLRFDMKLVNLQNIVAQSAFKVFRSTIEAGGLVKALLIPSGGTFTRKQIDDLELFVKQYGASGLAWIAYTPEGMKSPVAKFLSEEEIRAISEVTHVQGHDLIAIVAGKPKVVHDALGNLRLKIGKESGLIAEDEYKFLWVTEFPLLEWDDDEKRFTAMHHPFTMPMWEDIPLMKSDPGAVRAQAYDIVLNGFEIGGGSMRIFQRELQEQMFELLGFTLEEAKKQFGFLLDAFEYGTPPHGGIAFGIDRIIMLMAGMKSLRDVIAFPKTASGTDPMTQAPSPVTDRQLRDLHIQLRKPK